MAGTKAGRAHISLFAFLEKLLPDAMSPFIFQHNKCSQIRIRVIASWVGEKHEIGLRAGSPN
ncbi:hypothetical protein KSD_76740 [Ktedonobacter sp. SOSP1-85]|nr:hypothetical protein KSD_76740 [Ktedonobacter sp. SOSP1-85]